MRTGRKEQRQPRRHEPVRTHKTALVIVPPESAWEAIQAIRLAHDPKFRRWMPHVNLLYPFRPRREFDFLTLDLVETCGSIPAFEATLAEFQAFEHGGGRFTLFLEVQPAEAVRRFHEALRKRFPDCDEVSNFPGGYRPHLSVGQTEGRDNAERLREELQAGWKPLAFAVRDACLIWRADPPEDVFRVERRIPLGAPR
ncbi:MAG: 2'-5' RNA ligase family protein [Betaproteobacteria bacterium]|nr:2'-5' RNA ligase family protein [Betaproteobacteria bacterium]